jgi:hypothetical protein
MAEENTIRRIGEVFAAERPKSVLVLPGQNPKDRSGGIQPSVIEGVKIVIDESKKIGALTDILVPWFFGTKDGVENGEWDEMSSSDLTIRGSLDLEPLERNKYDASIVAPWCSCCGPDYYGLGYLDINWKQLSDVLQRGTKSLPYLFSGKNVICKPEDFVEYANVLIE